MISQEGKMIPQEEELRLGGVSVSADVQLPATHLP
jgi:hypothetical protein